MFFCDGEDGGRWVNGGDGMSVEKAGSGFGEYATAAADVKVVEAFLGR